jgi:hypothetical protein
MARLTAPVSSRAGVAERAGDAGLRVADAGGAVALEVVDGRLLLVEAVINWLEFGDDQRDDEMIELTTAGLHALVESWKA